MYQKRVPATAWHVPEHAREVGGNMTRHIFGLFIIGMAAYGLTQGQVVLGVIGALAGLAIVTLRPGEWGQ